MNRCEWFVNCDDVVLLEGGYRGCAVESSNGSFLAEQSSVLASASCAAVIAEMVDARV